MQWNINKVNKNIMGMWYVSVTILYGDMLLIIHTLLTPMFKLDVLNYLLQFVVTYVQTESLDGNRLSVDIVYYGPKSQTNKTSKVLCHSIVHLLPIPISTFYQGIWIQECLVGGENQAKCLVLDNVILQYYFMHLICVITAKLTTM